MSRRNKNKNSNTGSSNTSLPTGPPPTHPIEMSGDHRSFLIRSLDRCDTEYAALVQLNRSLKLARDTITEKCGASILLDLGEGLVKLNPNGDGLEGESAKLLTSQDEHNQCVDFLSRMALRRRLLNRIARRLNRLSHSMDGHDIAPPTPPKYGDLRLHIDAKAVADYADHWKQEEEAKQRIELRKAGVLVAPIQQPQEELEPQAESQAETADHNSKYVDKENEQVKLPEDAVKGTSATVTDTFAAFTNAAAATSAAVPKPEETASALKTGDPPEPAISIASLADAAAPSSAPTADGTAPVPAPTTECDGANPAPAPSADAATLAPAHPVEGSILIPAAEESTPTFPAKPVDGAAPAPAEPAVKAEATSAELSTPSDALKKEPSPEKASGPAAGSEEAFEDPEQESTATAAPEDKYGSPMVEAAPDATTSTEPKPDKVLTNQVVNSTQGDYDLIRDYNDAYEQVLDLSTQQRTFAMLLQEAEDDETAALDTMRHYGIGARGTSMTMREKQVELQRWKAAVLAKVPDQPSAADLGLTHRVFGLEERRKALLVVEELESKDDDVEMKEKDVDDDVDAKKRKRKREDSDDSEDDDASKDSEGGKDQDSKDSEDEKDDDDDNEKADEDKKKDDEKIDDDEDDKKKAKEQEELLIPKRVKPMSLLPIPSFYEQDLNRVRLIHADLMSNSIHEHARKRLAEVTNDYNGAFRSSNELYSQRVKLQTDVNTITHQHRMEISKLKNDYTMQAAISRARWQKAKEAWEIKKAKKAVQSMYGQMPMGTNHTQNASRHPNQIVNTVGLSLGRIVDAVVKKFEGGGSNENETFADHVPPQSPDFNGIVVNPTSGETFGQRALRVESTARSQMQTLTARLQQSEEDRKRAWRKLMKTKAEFEMPASGRRRLDPSQAGQVPLPPLRASTVIPQSSTSYQPAPVPAYVPPAINRRPVHTSSGGTDYATLLSVSESKYSAARVRERISSDGTVRPVAEPKRDKDGLFMRPAGRTRKGMNWDAVRGIWVPGG